MAPAARLRLFYFLYYGSVGAVLPYFAPYLRGLGFTGAQIGVVQMVSPLVAAPVALAWSTVSDRLGAPGRALAIATAWSAVVVAALPLARTPLAVGAVLLLFALGDRCIVPLVDSVTLEWVRSEPRLSYARIRLFGSLGYIAVAQGLGALLAARGDRAGDALVPLAIAALVAGYAIVARRLPSPPRPAERPGAGDMAGLLRDPRLLLLLAACAVHWGSCAPFHILFGVFVRDAGLPSSLTGLGMAVGVAAEVLALLAFPRLEARFGLRALFTAAFVGSAVRWALASRCSGAAAIVGVQALHALTFGVFWGASVNAMAQLVPPRLRATGQALFSAIVFGGGNAVGYSLAGAGYDRLGGVAPLFAIAALTELVALAIFWAASAVARRGAGQRWLA
jgi:MFS transporter, PPP family, 3-phenylpropionic acid transporter